MELSTNTSASSIQINKRLTKTTTTKMSGTDLTQYINPTAQGKARQALQAHHGASYMDSYKTVMCQTWLETASCGFGSNCKFAHGEAELRQSSFPPPSINTRKYKTRLCDKYTKKGICPYGQRCLFIHPEMPADLLDASTFRESDTYQSSLQIATTTHHSQTSVPLFVPSTIQNQQQQQQSLMDKQRRSSLPCETQQLQTQADAHLWNSTTDLYLPPVPLRYHQTSLFVPLAQSTTWGKMRERRSSVPCDPPQMPTLTEAPWTSSIDLQSSCSPENVIKSQPSIWSSHEDVFTTIFQESPESNFSNSDSVHSLHYSTILPTNSLIKIDDDLDDSYGCLKDFRETLATSIANVLDLSDVNL